VVLLVVVIVLVGVVKDDELNVMYIVFSVFYFDVIKVVVVAVY